MEHNKKVFQSFLTVKAFHLGSFYIPNLKFLYIDFAALVLSHCSKNSLANVGSKDWRQ